MSKEERKVVKIEQIGNIIELDAHSGIRFDEKTVRLKTKWVRPQHNGAGIEIVVNDAMPSVLYASLEPLMHSRRVKVTITIEELEAAP